MTKKLVLVALIIVFCMLVAPTFQGFPAVADTAPVPNANEGQFVFFQVNGGATATVNPGGQVAFNFSFLPHQFMNHGTVQIVDVPDNSLATLIVQNPNPFVWDNKAVETPCNGSVTYTVANIAGSNFTVYAIFTMETDSGSYSFGSSIVHVDVQSLTFTKAVNKITARPGDQLTYTILFTNPSSSVILFSVQLTDIIPAYTSYITHSTNLGQATPVLPGSDAVIWNIGALVPGQTLQATLIVRTSTAAQDNTVIENTANFVGYKYEGGFLLPVSVAPAVSPQVTVTTSLPGLDMLQGWNLIGIPSRQATPWSSLSISRDGLPPVGLDQAVDAGWISRTAYAWAGTFYQPIGSGGTFEPMRGCWFKTYFDGLTMYFPQ